MPKRKNYVSLMAKSALIAGLGIASIADASIRYAWVQLVPTDSHTENVYTANAQIRAIVNSGDKCEDVQLVGEGNFPTMVKREKPKEGFFNHIDVCDALLTKKHISKPQNIFVSMGEKKISLRVPNISSAIPLNQLIVLGDTGCRYDDKYQHCLKVSDWPFEQIIDNAVTRIKKNDDPPIILHVGDYRYSESNLAKPIIDSFRKWGGWNTEFFHPARELLNKGAWIFLRGNHEQCLKLDKPKIHKHVGNGFLYFFGSSDLNKEQERCKAIEKLYGHDTFPTYAIDFKPSPDSNSLRIVAMDLVHKVLDKYMKKEGYQEFAKSELSKYTNMFNGLEEVLNDRVPSIIISHIGLFDTKKNTTPDHIILDALSYSKLVDGKKLIENVPLVISGHVHDLQLVDPNLKTQALNGHSFKRPKQYIIGNGGALLSDDNINEVLDIKWKAFTKDSNDDINYVEKWAVQRKKAFGYMVVDVDTAKDSYTAQFTNYFFDKESQKFSVGDNSNCSLEVPNGNDMLKEPLTLECAGLAK
ncbi:metallophosphoesterase [Candidatus Parabeggiatoa sp. HSG14]|uniref:metallophosphoesterase family protein n=1 Tax=Candidatus Parabeggiatoa sp. HSG14 TaxID=3055593 RepID=UPI0025A85949|nr:metallophosphoesterase [Thiotrichales bacterium HSG14]